MSKKLKDLKCSVCGYIPDQEDIDATGYGLVTCETCGKENVCDLCLFKETIKPDRENNVWGRLGDTYKCYSCTPLYKDNTGKQHLPGKKRKFWLEDEYFIYKKACERGR